MESVFDNNDTPKQPVKKKEKENLAEKQKLFYHNGVAGRNKKQISPFNT